MKKLLLVLNCISPYIFVGLIYISSEYDDLIGKFLALPESVLDIVYSIIFLSPIIFFVLNIFLSTKLTALESIRYAKIIKLVHIPYHLFILVISIGCLFFTLSIVLAGVGIFVLLMCIVLAYVYVLSTAPYSIKAIKNIKGFPKIILIISQFLFFWDVIGVFVSERRLKREPIDYES